MTTGVSKKLKFSQALQEIGAKKTGTRGEAIKVIWAYAADNDLKESRRVKGKNTGGIDPDELLADVFQSDKWHSLGQIAKAVSLNVE